VCVLCDLKVSKSVSLLESAPPAADDYYRAISITSLVEYSVGPSDIPTEEKVCCSRCTAFTNQLFLLVSHTVVV